MKVQKIGSYAVEIDEKWDRVISICKEGKMHSLWKKDVLGYEEVDMSTVPAENVLDMILNEKDAMYFLLPEDQEP